MAYTPDNTDWPEPPPFASTSGGAHLPAAPAPVTGLNWFDVEISWGGTWVDLHDHLNYQVGADSLSGSQTTWRKVSADSPIAEGSYLIHAVKALVTDRVTLYIYGQTHNDLNENIGKAEVLFSQLDYRLRLTFDEYREYWRCQPADWTLSRNHTYAHNQMALMELSVPRFPTVSREMTA